MYCTLIPFIHTVIQTREGLSGSIRTLRVTDPYGSNLFHFLQSQTQQTTGLSTMNISGRHFEDQNTNPVSLSLATIKPASSSHSAPGQKLYELYNPVFQSVCGLPSLLL